MATGQVMPGAMNMHDESTQASVTYMTHIENALKQYFDDQFRTSGTQYPSTRMVKRTHRSPEDQTNLLIDLGEMVSHLAVANMTWVNSPKFMPIEYSNNIHIQSSKLEFGDSFPAEVPDEGVVPVIESSVEYRFSRMGRYGLGVKWEWDNMTTERGQYEFLQSVLEIQLALTMQMAMEAVYVCVRPDSDEINFARTMVSESQWRDAYAREVNFFAMANKCRTGAFDIINEYAKDMETRSKKPTVCVVDGRKHALFSTGNPLLTENYLGGDAATNRLLEGGSLARIGSIEIMPVPLEKQRKNMRHANSILDSRVQIGSFYHIDNSKTQSIPLSDYTTIGHSRHMIFDEKMNDYVIVEQKDMIENCMYFDQGKDTLDTYFPELMNRETEIPKNDPYFRENFDRKNYGEMCSPRVVSKVMEKIISNGRKYEEIAPCYFSLVENRGSCFQRQLEGFIEEIQKAFYVSLYAQGPVFRKKGGYVDVPVYRGYMRAGDDDANFDRLAQAERLLQPQHFDRDLEEIGREWIPLVDENLYVRACDKDDILPNYKQLAHANVVAIDHRKGFNGTWGVAADVNDPIVDGYYPVIPGVDREKGALYDDNDADFAARNRTGAHMKMTPPREHFYVVRVALTDFDRKFMICPFNFFRALFFTTDEIAVQQMTNDDVYGDAVFAKRNPSIPMPAGTRDIESFEGAESGTTTHVLSFFDEVRTQLAKHVGKWYLSKEDMFAFLRNDIPLPVSFILFQPFRNYVMSGALLAHGGSELGTSYFGWLNYMHGADAGNKTGALNATWRGVCHLKSPELRQFIRTFSYNGVVRGGCEAKIATAKAVNDYIQGGGEGYLAGGSLIATMIGYDEKPDFQPFLDFSGCTGNANDTTDHYSSAWFYRTVWPMLESFRRSNNTDGRELNTVCYKGSMKSCVTREGSDFSLYTVNQGHHGEKEFAGVMKFRNYGLGVIEC